MRHLTAIGIKFVVHLIALGLVLAPMARLGTGPFFALAVVVAGVLYATGDLMILPAMGNWTATLADAGLAALLVWVTGLVWPMTGIGIGEAIAAGLAIGVVEYFLHRFLLGFLFERQGI